MFHLSNFFTLQPACTYRHNCSEGDLSKMLGADPTGESCDCWEKPRELVSLGSCSRSLECIHLALLKPYTSWLATPHVIFFLAHGNHYSAICFCEFDIFDMSYQSNHAVSVLPCLASFTLHNVIKIHPCCLILQDFLHS